jgi:excisionase family DNA binding protein
METLTLEQAAEILHMHKVTVRNKARSGEIPAAKIGKRWLFLEIDLVNWLRLQYVAQALQGDKPNEEKLCHSSSVKIVLNGGLSLPSTDDEYRKVLGLTTARPHRSTMTV